MQLFGTGLVLIALLGGSGGAGLQLPDDPRLASVKPRLEAIVAKTTAAGLPAELVVSKVREGLAKGVDGSRIEMAANRLADSLGAARATAAAHYARTPSEQLMPLVRALAEARMLGLEAGAMEDILRSRRPVPEAVRALELLGDLSVRGYPAGRAVTVVKDVLVRDPGSISQVTAALEGLRQEQALSHVESVDALARGLEGTDSLKAGYGRAVENERRRGVGQGQAKKKEEREVGANKKGFVPPGLAKMKEKVRGPK